MRPEKEEENNLCEKMRQETYLNMFAGGGGCKCARNKEAAPAEGHPAEGNSSSSPRGLPAPCPACAQGRRIRSNPSPASEMRKQLFSPLAKASVFPPQLAPVKKQPPPSNHWLNLCSGCKRQPRKFLLRFLGVLLPSQFFSIVLLSSPSVGQEAGATGPAPDPCQLPRRGRRSS